jgi:hypothetical protein
MKDPEIAAGMYHLSGNKSLSRFVYYLTHAPVDSADLRLGESSLSTNVKDAVDNLNKLPQRPDRSRLSLGQLSRLRNIMKSHGLEKNPMRQLWKPSRRLMLARPYLLTIPSPEFCVYYEIKQSNGLWYPNCLDTFEDGDAGAKVEQFPNLPILRSSYCEHQKPYRGVLHA